MAHWLIPVLQVADLFVQGFSAQSLTFTLLTIIVYASTLGIVFWDAPYMASWFNRVYPDAAKLTMRQYEIRRARERHLRKTMVNYIPEIRGKEFLDW